MRLLILRPKESAQGFLKKLAALGHEVTHFPISKQIILDNPMPAPPFSGLVMTSAVAVRFFHEKIATDALASYQELPLYCVGNKTAKQAEELGFLNVLSADGDGAALAKLILEKHSTGSLLYPCAQKRQFDLSAALANSDVSIHNWVVYESQYQNQLPKMLIEKISNQQFDGVFHFSAMSAKHFFYLLEKHNILNHIEGVKQFMLSKEISRHIPTQYLSDMAIAELPNEDAILDLVKNHV